MWTTLEASSLKTKEEVELFLLIIRYSFFIIHSFFILPEILKISTPRKNFLFSRKFQVFSLRFRENRLQYLLMSLKY